MVRKMGDNSNTKNKGEAPVLEGQEIKLLTEQGMVKDYVVVIIDSEGVHLAEWDLDVNEPTGIMITIPPEGYDRIIGKSTK